MPTISDDAGYTGAWNEAMRRVVARDTIVLGYFAVCAALLGGALSKDGGGPLAVGIPYLTFVAGALLAHHDFIIAMLNRHLRQFSMKDGTPTWQIANLAAATRVGWLLHTLPIVLAAVVLNYVSLAQLSKVAPNVLTRLSPYAAWTGTALLFMGRIAQTPASRVGRKRTLRVR